MCPEIDRRISTKLSYRDQTIAHDGGLLFQLGLFITGLQHIQTAFIRPAGLQEYQRCFVTRETSLGPKASYFFGLPYLWYDQDLCGS